MSNWTAKDNRTNGTIQFCEKCVYLGNPLATWFKESHLAIEKVHSVTVLPRVFSVSGLVGADSNDFVVDVLRGTNTM